MLHLVASAIVASAVAATAIVSTAIVASAVVAALAAHVAVGAPLGRLSSAVRAVEHEYIETVDREERGDGVMGGAAASLPVVLEAGDAASCGGGDGSTDALPCARPRVAWDEEAALAAPGERGC